MGRERLCQSKVLGLEPRSLQPEFSAVAFRPLYSLRNFCERVLIIFFAKIMAVIFDVNESGRLGRERNLYQGGE